MDGLTNRLPNCLQPGQRKAPKRTPIGGQPPSHTRPHINQSSRTSTPDPIQIWIHIVWGYIQTHLEQFVNFSVLAFFGCPVININRNFHCRQAETRRERAGNFLNNVARTTPTHGCHISPYTHPPAGLSVFQSGVGLEAVAVAKFIASKINTQKMTYDLTRKIKLSENKYFRLESVRNARWALGRSDWRSGSGSGGGGHVYLRFWFAPSLLRTSFN